MVDRSQIPMRLFHLVATQSDRCIQFFFSFIELAEIRQCSPEIKVGNRRLLVLFQRQSQIYFGFRISFQTDEHDPMINKWREGGRRDFQSRLQSVVGFLKLAYLLVLHSQLIEREHKVWVK